MKLKVAVNSPFFTEVDGLHAGGWNAYLRYKAIRDKDWRHNSRV